MSNKQRAQAVTWCLTRPAMPCPQISMGCYNLNFEKLPGGCEAASCACGFWPELVELHA